MMKLNFKASVRRGSPLLFGLALFLSAQLGWALTLKDLIRRSRQFCADSAYLNSQPRLTDARITDLLNEGQRYTVGHTWAFVKRTQFNLVGGTTEYAAPTDFQTSMRVTKDNSVLYEQTLDALDTDSASWPLVQGEAQYYYVRTATNTVIGFYPAPTISSTGTITLDYAVNVSQLVNSTDEPFNGTVEFKPFHESLAKFVAYRYYLLMGNQALADVYAKEFASDVKRMAEIPKIKPNYRPGITIDR